MEKTEPNAAVAAEPQAEDDQVKAKKAAQEERKKQFEELKSGVKHLLCSKRKMQMDLSLQNGVVAAGQGGNAKTMIGWSLDKVLDWADRCNVAVYVSEAGKPGKRIATQPLAASQRG